MCLSEVLARHAHEQPILPRQPPSAPSSAYSDEDLEGSLESDLTSDGPSTPDATQPASPTRPALSLLITQIRPKYLERPNERLAVLLPKSLWKPDNMADECDIWTCTTKFSLFERRHHCRKCGGVFCQACSSQQTLLLDTTNLPFFYPPSDLCLADGPPGPMVNSPPHRRRAFHSPLAQLFPAPAPTCLRSVLECAATAPNSHGRLPLPCAL
ncbi:hypothetical protein BN14_01924 [Rhizoctonia solani AG-1 IB]|uniref:FYVE-type domain-containing protein n=1 Tax=Thanatephorus cucumeris (strain AG1-IB / isolate 7/3/14) TaxID=1108050 RepID=M5BM16_THACB|nr:hypothetical protein BN14_01924 [Rhizoctonia solani AG-1 IB]